MVKSRSTKVGTPYSTIVWRSRFSTPIATPPSIEGNNVPYAAIVRNRDVTSGGESDVRSSPLMRRAYAPASRRRDEG